MNPYREPPAHLESDHVVFLPRAYQGRHDLRYLLGHVLVLPLAFAVPQLFRALVHGGGDWTLLGWVPVLLLLPVVLTRVRLRGSILIGARSIRRVGFLRERVTTWDQLAEVPEAPRSGSPSKGAQAALEELERAQLFVRDRSGMLGWTLDAAREGRFAEIAQRVHAEGRAPRRWRWYVPEAAAVLAMVLLASIEPVLDIQQDAAWAQRRAEVDACMASISGTDPTHEALRVLCLQPRDTP
jgi:hypothetical protein